jgi:hypothetical protein|tara:strand:+ start:91 stop:753 length:663 start_codon:yes stop_codon:yes gene_type:complete
MNKKILGGIFLLYLSLIVTYSIRTYTEHLSFLRNLSSSFGMIFFLALSFFIIYLTYNFYEKIKKTKTENEQILMRKTVKISIIVSILIIFFISILIFFIPLLHGLISLLGSSLLLFILAMEMIIPIVILNIFGTSILYKNPKPFTFLLIPILGLISFNIIYFTFFMLTVGIIEPNAGLMHLYGAAWALFGIFIVINIFYISYNIIYSIILFLKRKKNEDV